MSASESPFAPSGTNFQGIPPLHSQAMAKHKCPKCKKMYKPKYASQAEAERAAENNTNELWTVEQHMSRICSDACWDACSEMEIFRYKFLQSGYYEQRAPGVFVAKER